MFGSDPDCSGDNCSTDDVVFRDDDNGTLISPGGKFELGFFTPDGSSNKARYLGIWYYGSVPKLVVWVANRDRPLLDSNGCLAVRNGVAMVLDAKGSIYWSTNPVVHGRQLKKLDFKGLKPPGVKNASVSSNFSTNLWSLQLIATGNLVLNDRRDRGVLWQSFDHPTDTFLPGMSSDGVLNLTSWQTHGNPAVGKFTLMQWQTLQITEAGSMYYWEDGDTPFDQIPTSLSDMLFGSKNVNNTRLVMSFTGQAQFWKWEAKTGWSLIWSEPKDKCSLYNVCGDFGSCNSNNAETCKCLPGFEPTVPTNWSLGDFSSGCSSKSEACKRAFSDDVFLRMPLMKVGTPNRNESTDNQECEARCRDDCNCVAYSCGSTDCTRVGMSGKKDCLIWRSTGLTHLQEEFSEGFTVYVRSTRSDIALTSRDCDPCGTNVVPYPLSTAPNCGDASYKYFHCNKSNGQLQFSTSNSAFKVIATSPETQTFTIQTMDASNCDKMRANIESLILSPKPSLPFKVTNCTLVNQSFAEVEQYFTEVEISWYPPLEPTCNTSLNCSEWAHTTCKARNGDEMRCICGSKFKWDGSNLKCREKPKFPVKVVVSCISGALAVVLCGIFFIHYLQKRREAERQDAVEFQGDDSGAIDVPFFDWGSILAATTNFADENKLGTGGFGAVYKGKLHDGKEIAVKRLSTVSEQGIEEFRTEVVLIAKLQHRNLVRLLGYCVKAHERILVYEYMPNGSLDSCLFDQTRSVFLDWEKRFDIIFGIARGLVYLHQDSRLRIIHRDLKPSNILLDEELDPKISDFGIARIVGGKDTEGSTIRVVGTYGYMSPEYAYEGIFSVKSDVFSFGIVVLETISGRRNSKRFQIEHGLNLQGYAWKLWNEDRGLDLVDQALKESCKQSQALKCIHIGLLCVQEDPGDRPTMSAVVWMFGAENASLPNPKQPAFISKKEPSETASSSSLINSSSNNVITISMEGR